jgi:predicted membrane metal-binding protein
MAALQLPSDKSFGITFTVVFALIAGWLGWRGGAYWQAFAALAALFLAVSLAVPRILRPLNALWMRFGALLNRIVSPIVLGAIYFVVITPVALLFRVIGRDELHRSFDRAVPTYWVTRNPPGPDGPSSFPRQF